MNTCGSWCFRPAGLKASPATRAAPSSTTFRPSRPEISRLPLGAQTRRGSSSGSWSSEFWTISLLGESSSVTLGSGFIFVVLLPLLLLLNSLFSLFPTPSSSSLFHPVFRLFSQHVTAWKELVFVPLEPPSNTGAGVVTIQSINNDTPFIGKATGIMFTFHAHLFFPLSNHLNLHLSAWARFPSRPQTTRAESQSRFSWLFFL